MELKPSEIRYSQDSINNMFDKKCQHSGQLIGETLDDICEGRCSVHDIPTISVIERDGKWITRDNRRLWVFRQLERLGKVDTVPVRKVYNNYIPPDKLTSVNGGRDVTVRRRPGGYWHNRPAKQRAPRSRSLQDKRQVYSASSESPRPFTDATNTGINNRINAQHPTTTNYGYPTGTSYNYGVPAYNPVQSWLQTAGTDQSMTQSTYARNNPTLSHVGDTNSHNSFANQYTTTQTRSTANQFGRTVRQNGSPPSSRSSIRSLSTTQDRLSTNQFVGNVHHNGSPPSSRSSIRSQSTNQTRVSANRLGRSDVGKNWSPPMARSNTRSQPAVDTSDVHIINAPARTRPSHTEAIGDGDTSERYGAPITGFRGDNDRSGIVSRQQPTRTVYIYNDSDKTRKDTSCCIIL